MHIAVTVQMKQKAISLLVISGHAPVEPAENFSLVCAQVSAISVGILNSIDTICPNTCDLTMEDGFVSIKVRKSSEQVQTILKTLLIQLETVEYTNKKTIKIEKVEV